MGLLLLKTVHSIDFASCGKEKSNYDLDNKKKEWYKAIDKIKEILTGKISDRPKTSYVKSGFFDCSSPRCTCGICTDGLILQNNSRNNEEVLSKLFTPFGAVMLLKTGERDAMINVSEKFMKSTDLELEEITGKCFVTTDVDSSTKMIPIITPSDDPSLTIKLYRINRVGDIQISSLNNNQETDGYIETEQKHSMERLNFYKSCQRELVASAKPKSEGKHKRWTAVMDTFHCSPECAKILCADFKCNPDDILPEVMSESCNNGEK